MKRFRRILSWATLVVILLLVVLCIVGAFLGADRAKAMFNSLPLCIFWVVLAILLAVGLFAWKSMWRSPGLLAVHVGLLLILAGGVWGSRAGHAWRAQLSPSNQAKPAEGFLVLNPHDETNNASNQLWNLPPTGQPTPTDSLPFEIEARRAWLEYYPPADATWTLLGVTYDEKDSPKQVTPFNGKIGIPNPFPAVDGDVTVLGYNPALRRIELQLTHNGEAMTNSIIAGPADVPTLLSLADAFDTPQAWQKAGQPTIVLLPSPQEIRDYKAELVLHAPSRNVIASGVIEINHPLHAEGYHFYLSAFDPPMALVVKAVSDDGLYWVYAGFALLMLGVVLRLWIEKAFRREGKPA